jgi:lipoprotein-releasing system permease protein
VTLEVGHLSERHKPHQSGFSIEKAIGYKNYAEKATDKYPMIKDWINLFDNYIAIIITLMLVVVVINIIMVLLILIIERTNSMVF